MLCPATALPPSSHVKLTHVASPRHHPQLEITPPRPGSVSHRTHGAALAREIRKGSGVVLRPRVGVARPSVRQSFPSDQSASIQPPPRGPRGDDYCHRRTSSSSPHSAWGGALGFPSRSPRLAAHQGLPVGPPPGPPRRWGLRPARARGMRPVPRSMGNGTKAAADVREGQLMLMDQCLAATSQAVVHTAFRYGLANLT
ncbi:uncharacterized protein LOC123449513 [Hordeum vulgare subsp. vulgare]|uniref:uncharacterized protein LOC123449513 n=1 Tax=Hordeum vulgare subsp. vulgare TaxID=112509 RepID=UPI00162E70B6|nr:uncharacterized protein LOC123449513 [Hordeum vulgare subsp. vulgare]